MPTFRFSNAAGTKLVATLQPTMVTCEVEDASDFPTIAPGEFFSVVFEDELRSRFEVAHVSGVNGNELSLVRGQDGTAAMQWEVGDSVDHRITAGVLANFVQNS